MYPFSYKNIIEFIYVIVKCLLKNNYKKKCNILTVNRKKLKKYYKQKYKIYCWLKTYITN